MKKSILVLLVMLFSISGAFAQLAKGLKGPDAKNYKPWKDKNRTSVVVVTQKTHKLQGPAAKNFKPWREEKQSKSFAVKFGNSEKNKLRSYEAKNYKPWKAKK